MQDADNGDAGSPESAAREIAADGAAPEIAAAPPATRLLTLRQGMPLLLGVATGAGMLAFYATEMLTRLLGPGPGPLPLAVVFELTFTFVAAFGAVMVGFLVWGALAWLGVGTRRCVGRGALLITAAVALLVGIGGALLG